jgi:hypothetical protein
MSRKLTALLTLPLLAAILVGCSLGGLLQAPAETPTPTKTFVPTFTAIPTAVASPSDTPEPTSPPEPTAPPESPTPTEPPSPTVGPPTSTATPRPPAPTSTPAPPPPTNTPQPTYDYVLTQPPIKDFCHAGTCLPEVRGDVLDAQGNPVDRYSVTVKIDSPVFGVQFCAVGDEVKMLQPGQFKFESPDGRAFGDYSLTVVRSQGDPTPLSQSYQLGGQAALKGQHTGIVFQRKF